MRADLLPTTIEGKFWRLAEEASEVVKAMSKFQRHGATATDPKTGVTYDNRADVLSEVADLEHACAEVRRALVDEWHDAVPESD